MPDEEQELNQLSQLRVAAPENVFARLRRRIQAAQLGKDLIERQAMSFWIVLDSFLRLFFAPHRPPRNAPLTPETDEKKGPRQPQKGDV